MEPKTCRLRSRRCCSGLPRKSSGTSRRTAVPGRC
jgi:hypothetical protein